MDDVTASRVSPTPPTTDDIVAVLTLGAVPAEQVERVALHLATPLDVIVGVDALVDTNTSTWVVGGAVFAPPPVGDDESYDLIRYAITAEWALDASRSVFGASSAGYCNVAAGQAGWVKPTVSGTRHLAFGAELFCGHHVSADANMAADVVADVAGWAIVGSVELPAVGVAGGQSVLVEERFGFWKISSADVGADIDGEIAAADMAQISDCAQWVAEQLGGISRIHRVVGRGTGSSDAELSVLLAGDWIAALPVRVSDGAEVVGETCQNVGAWIYEGVVPAGYQVIGPAKHNDGVIAVHEASGLRVRLLEATLGPC